MKTKEQILKWLDKQPWKGEFYEAAATSNRASIISYSEDLLNRFEWSSTKQGTVTWMGRNEEYLKWYNAKDKPMSWEAYCEQNPITKGDCCIEDGEVCEMWNPLLTPQARDPKTCVDVMSEKLCDAFIAYMKLVQLRAAWVQDHGGFDDMYYKIVTLENRTNLYLIKTDYSMNGLSFADRKTAHEFIETFQDLLKTAAPLL